mgnify:CR=1 FL=1
MFKRFIKPTIKAMAEATVGCTERGEILLDPAYEAEEVEHIAQINIYKNGMVSFSDVDGLRPVDFNDSVISGMVYTSKGEIIHITLTKAHHTEEI